MKYFIAITDSSWFSFLAALQPDEVNFWRPSGRLFGAVEVGTPYLFKLHSPEDYIVGGGSFVRSFNLPLSLAWDAFGEKNGAPDIISLRDLINKHRSDSPSDPEIGCIILNEPFFLHRESWIPVPSDWSRNIVTGKTYDTSEPAGREFWERVMQARVDSLMNGSGSMIAEGGGQYGREYYPLHGRKLSVLPDTAAERPQRDFIEWHNTKVFVARFASISVDLVE